MSERLAGTELFKDVVHFSERESGVKLLLALAMCIKTLGNFADGLLLSFAGIWKWERVEAQLSCCSAVGLRAFRLPRVPNTHES